MQLHEQAGIARGGQQLARLVNGEHPRLAEDVGKARQPLARDDGQHLVHQEVEIRATAVGALAEVERDLVRAEPRGDDAHRQRRREAPHDVQGLELVLEGEAVAGLHLDGGDAMRGELTQPRLGERKEVILVARAQVTHRRVDAPAALRNLHVGHARRAQLLLLESRPAEDGVRVRVHEARSEHTTLAVHHACLRVRRAEGPLLVHGGDAILLDEYRDTLAHDRVAHLRAAPSASRPGAGDDLRRVDEQQPGRRHAAAVGRPITSRTRDKRSGACASPRQA